MRDTNGFSPSNDQMNGVIKGPPPPVAPKPLTLSPQRPENECPKISPHLNENDEKEKENGEDLGEDLDEKRLNRKAYDYLCRLSEVRNWLVECLQDDSISPATSLEKSLQNGVFLARISNYFAPEVVPITSIYDLDQRKYESRLAIDPENPLVYRHTDNIVLWRKALESIRLPEILIPETADVYEGRNVKTVFCLYAMAKQLYRMRRGPPIRNLAGKAVFTRDELDLVKDQVKELPEFSEVGSFLGTGASKKSEDDESIRSAIRRIEEIIKNKEDENLLGALQNPDAQLLYVEKDLIIEYGRELNEMLSEKGSLSRSSIQESISNINAQSGLNQLNRLLNGGEEISNSSILEALMWLQFEDIRESALPLYISILRKKAEQNEILTRELVFQAISEGNGLLEVKLAAIHGNSKDTLNSLQNPLLELETKEENSRIYHNRLANDYSNSTEDFFLTKNHLNSIISELNGISPEQRKVLEIEGAIERNDNENLMILFSDLYPNSFIQDHFEFYKRNIAKREGKLSAEDLRKLIDETNQMISDAYQTAELLVILNESLLEKDRQKAGKSLEILSKRQPDVYTSFREDFREIYVEYLIEEITKRNPKRKQGDQEEWFWYDFSLGTVSVEVNEKRFNPQPKQPKIEGFFEENQIEKVFFEQNLAEEEKQKRKAEEIEDESRRNEAASKIQNKYKNWKHQRDHHLLCSSETPSLLLVRKFLPSHKEQTDQIDEQIEIEEQKSEVTQLLAANQQLDSQLQELDEKIGLLIKNRINLQEVVAHKQKIHDSADKFQLRHFTLRKKEKEVTDRLGHLFFILQAEPHLLANLLMATSAEKQESLLIKIIGPVFGHLSENREQYLAVGLLCELLMKGVESSSNIDHVLSSKPLQIVSIALRTDLFSPLSAQVAHGSVIEELNQFFHQQDKIQAFNLNPDEIYLSIYGQKPTDTGAAVQCPHVEQVLEASKGFLANWSERLSEAISKSYKLLKGLRFICLSFQSSLRAKFPSISSLMIDKIISQFIYESVIRVQLHSIETLKNLLGQDISEEGQRKLDAVLTFIGFAVANKGYGSAKWYLTSLNRQIHTIHESFRICISNQLSGETTDMLFGLNRFTHFDASNKPSLSILQSDLKRVIEYIHKHHKEMSNDEIFTRLSKSCKTPSEGSEGDRVISIHLQPPSSARENTESHERFIRTKRQLIELLLSGIPGTNILEIISERENFDENIEKRHSILFPDSPKISEIQSNIRENLDILEKDGRISKEDNYQSLVTDMANDIRLSTRRMKEREEQRKSLVETRNRLETQRGELKDRLNQYEEYLDVCLENLSRNSKRLSFRPTTDKTQKIHKTRMSVDTKEMSYKVSGDKLHKKGVLWTVDGYEHKFSKLQFQIHGTDNKGVFNIHLTDGKDLNLQGNIDLQDLLQANYAEDQDFRFMEIVIFKTSPLLILLNKKFYNK